MMAAKRAEDAVFTIRADIWPGGHKARLFNDDIFAELRTLAGVPEDFTNLGWDISKLMKGGGKGGTMMARIGTSYIVKELSVKDHGTLLSVARSYSQHVRSDDTLLCPIYLHFRDIISGRYFFAMRNVVGRGPFHALYDIKGCSDDKTMELDGNQIEAVHKRFYHVWLWCGQFFWTAARERYFAGKRHARRVQLVMTPEQREKFLRCIERDTQWLASNYLMDYSLVVAFRQGRHGKLLEGDEAVMSERQMCNTVSEESTSNHMSMGFRPMTRTTPEGTEVTVCAAIIDYLQRWTAGKKVARVVKVLETNKSTIPPRPYAARFLRHFQQRVISQPGEQIADAKANQKSPMPGAASMLRVSAAEAQATEWGLCSFWTGSSQRAASAPPNLI